MKYVVYVVNVSLLLFPYISLANRPEDVNVRIEMNKLQAVKKPVVKKLDIAFRDLTLSEMFEYLRKIEHPEMFESSPVEKRCWLLRIFGH